jgi:hypothetical protein
MFTYRSQAEAVLPRLKEALATRARLPTPQLRHHTLQLAERLVRLSLPISWALDVR